MKTILVLIIAVAAFGPVANVSAQITIDTTGQRLGVRPFDHPVNPDTYLIRPGERLEVIFVNTKLSNMHLMVNAEGKIVDRRLGLIDLSQQTLTQVRERLIKSLSTLYNASEIIISIATIYPVSIRVSGAVNRPGRYFGYTSQTVSEIIDSAGGIAPDGSSRRILLSGGSNHYPVDLDRALYAGEYDYDPNLYAGQTVHVPRLEEEKVSVTGQVAIPRRIELLDGDDIEMLVALAGGQLPRALIAATFALNEPERDVSKPGAIHPGDNIRVPAVAQGGDVVITGAVNNPGYFALAEGMLFSDLVTSAGGLTSRAIGDRAVLFREVAPDTPDASIGGRYPLWVTASQRDKVLLIVGDSVYVPGQVGHVKLSGDVGRPGIYPFVPGKSVRFYLELSGHLNQNKSDLIISVTDAFSGLSAIRGTEGVVYDGDEITVGHEEAKP